MVEKTGNGEKESLTKRGARRVGQGLHWFFVESRPATNFFRDLRNMEAGKTYVVEAFGSSQQEEVRKSPRAGKRKRAH